MKWMRLGLVIWRVEDDSYVQDIILRPRRTAENISITFTADTWTQDET